MCSLNGSGTFGVISETAGKSVLIPNENSFENLFLWNANQWLKWQFLKSNILTDFNQSVDVLMGFFHPAYWWGKIITIFSITKPPCFYLSRTLGMYSKDPCDSRREPAFLPSQRVSGYVPQLGEAWQQAQWIYRVLIFWAPVKSCESARTCCQKHPRSTISLILFY